LKHYQAQIFACDFLTVETLGLQTLYVLFFIHVATRRVFVMECTAHPNSAWVTQQARQLLWERDENELAIRFLIHDRDAKFTPGFDTVFRSERIKIIRTPYRAPNANALATRPGSNAARRLFGSPHCAESVAFAPGSHRVQRLL
jgi:hypothetical protein